MKKKIQNPQLTQTFHSVVKKIKLNLNPTGNLNFHIIFLLRYKIEFNERIAYDENNNQMFGLYNRKEKSLGELCRRFLQLYGSIGENLLFLDQCTKELVVERRRIYDIINILESFFVIQRQAKNAYKWLGINKLEEAIGR